MWRLLAIVASFMIVCFSLNAVAEVERFILTFTIAPHKESLTVKIKNPPRKVDIKSSEPSPHVGLSPELLLAAEFESYEGWNLIFTNINDTYFDGYFEVNGLNQSVLIQPNGTFTLPIGIEGEGEIKGFSNQDPAGLGSERAEQEFLPPKEIELEQEREQDSESETSAEDEIL